MLLLQFSCILVLCCIDKMVALCYIRCVYTSIFLL